MKPPDAPLQFAARECFRQWLQTNAQASGGVWLLFGKPGGPKTLKASEALEEALCFGWIDGQMQRLNECSYIKYFSLRRPNSKWSDKNKALAETLEQKGLMTEQGRAKMAEARKNGQWAIANTPTIGNEKIAVLSALLQVHQPAYAHFLAMPPSVQKTYTRAYFDAKTDNGKEKRLAWIVGRLNQNLKPM